MAHTAQNVIDIVLNEYGFDGAVSSNAIGWVDSRHKIMVARSRCLKKRVTVGNTVAGQAQYPITMLEVDELLVDGTPYGRMRHVDQAMATQGFVVLSGVGGVVSDDADASGATQVGIYPVPTSGSSVITAYGSVRAPTISAGTDALVIDDEAFEGLVDGVAAVGMRRISQRGRFAQDLDQRFDQACDELKRRVQSRLKPSGPAQIRVVGLNA